MQMHRCPDCGKQCRFTGWHCDKCHIKWLKNEERHILGKNCGPRPQPIANWVLVTLGYPENWVERRVAEGRRIEEGAAMLSNDYEP
jgi:hypothetical protein